ncbi:MAG: cation:proton antiporter [Labilithrix sp.]|nr:cation:proton antiporter [Labilithrix sp.]
MHGEDLLRALAVVASAAALTAIVCQRLRQPLVLGYILAGLVVGPHLPVPLVADPGTVHTLSELGVILLMFSLGLEFSLRKLIRVGPGVTLTAVIQCSLLVWLGFVTGRAFGWTTLESLFTGAIIAISSTTIIAKAFEEQKVGGRLRELVVGVLIVEDLIAILMMAVLTTIATGAGLSPLSLGKTAARLGAFLVALVVIGLFVVPRAIRKIVALGRPEVTTVASVGLCFAIALLARELGYSVALGAFLAGSLVAESGEEKLVEQLVQPLRDVFGAVFFVSVGMMFDPALIAQHWLPIVVLTLVVVIGKIASVSFGAFVAGNGVRTSVQTGMSLAQIGEFSFIIAGLGLSLKATGPFLFPIAVAVSSITTLITPWLIRASGPVAEWIDRELPRPLQTFGALYASWLERLRRSEAEVSSQRLLVRRLVRMLAIDAVALVIVVLVTALASDGAYTHLVERRELSPIAARALVIASVAILAAPFCVGILRVSRKLALVLARAALPLSPQGVDLGAAPRRSLVITLQLGLLLMVGTPIVAITQPFLRGFHGAELLFLGVLALAVAFWRSAANLQGHVRASAQVLVEALARQTAEPKEEKPPPVVTLLDSLGEPVAVELAPEAPAVERTLAELNLRGATGATVLAITRGTESIVVPSARERLHAGDVLVVAGSREAIEAARLVLAGT